MVTQVYDSDFLMELEVESYVIQQEHDKKLTDKKIIDLIMSGYKFNSIQKLLSKIFGKSSKLKYSKVKEAILKVKNERKSVGI